MLKREFQCRSPGMPGLLLFSVLPSSVLPAGPEKAKPRGGRGFKGVCFGASDEEVELQTCKD